MQIWQLYNVIQTQFYTDISPIFNQNKKNNQDQSFHNNHYVIKRQEWRHHGKGPHWMSL